MTRLLAFAVFGSALAFTLVSCSSDTSDSAPESTFEPRPGTQSYDSAQAITDDLAAGGFPCETPFEIDSTSRMAANAGRCSIGGTETVLSVYTSTTDRDDSVNVQSSLLGPAGIEYGLLVGANWTVNCGSEATCIAMKVPMGGKIVAEDGK
ncbi:hypothetical protein E5720_12020 [Rhodococcus sp. PAMC28707]|uniref:hypothetical protein n=1 Tax=unclassified Rhodococcus (in: high G+C Gram-positive bacteria) TaxID=192944 RepID=UPI00109DA14E|nr:MULTISPECIES: hypothetical protein [unclassified Rhodococcus (in: high G+C Gram-positive bacteria)]QCB49197.1 hypothetical protein E5769_01995 [Rhodococcus sp. PAMC28705]QCB59115.1 hypothetical protein E5720_12020 [Rhodococcus sp. PAMC28707]